MFSNLFEKIHILQNLYIKNKCFLKKKSYSMDGEDIEIFNYFKDKKSTNTEIAVNGNWVDKRTFSFKILFLDDTAKSIIKLGLNFSSV